MVGSLTSLLQAERPLVLDGAMGTELQRRGVDTGLPLWSANALRERPEVVLQIHHEYIAAGADIITTNTFRTTRRAFRLARLPDSSAELTLRAVNLARTAATECPDRTILVAGSIAPLEDCYRPDQVPAPAELDEEHAELAARLARAGVDFLLLETMNTIREAEASCRAALATQKEVVVSFLCTGEGKIYGGESLEEAVARIGPLGPTGFSVNCVSPRIVDNAIERLVRSTSLPIAVYANVGIPGQERGTEFRCDISPEEYARWANQWVHAGISIVGGCCGTTPEYIRRVAAALRCERRPHPASSSGP